MHGTDRVAKISRSQHEEFKARVFEKFVQVDASDARLRGGTGLGLSIEKELTIRLGGDVSHDAAQDGGTIFRIDLPRGSAKATIAKSERSLASIQ
jgi:signal transduction histidine kinase